MLVTPGLLSTSRWLLRERAKPAMKTGDKLGMQPPAGGSRDGAKEIPSHQDGPGKRFFLGSCECS